MKGIIITRLRNCDNRFRIEDVGVMSNYEFLMMNNSRLDELSVILISFLLMKQRKNMTQSICMNTKLKPGICRNTGYGL